MSLIICAYDANSVTVCSEDRYGVFNETGTAFTHMGEGRVKSLKVSNFIFGIVGRTNASDCMKSFFREFAPFSSFDRLVETLPKIARELVNCAGDGARLSMLLTGWDTAKSKIRAIYWDVDSDKNDAAVEFDAPCQEGLVQLLILGSRQEAHDGAMRLMAQSAKRAPSCLAEVFSKLADELPEIGRVLTFNTVTRPSVKQIDCTPENICDANYKKTTPAQIQFISPTTGEIPASTALNKQGAIVPAVGIPVTVNLSPTSIEVVTTNQTRWFGDGNTITVLASDTTFSGLANSIVYYLYLRYNTTSGVISFGHGAGTPPTSPNSQFAANCSFDGFSPLGLLAIQTQAAGGTGGTGGGSGDTGGCPEGAEEVDIQGRGIIASRDVVIGDHILGENLATGEYLYRRVTNVTKHPNSTWRIVDGHRVTQRETIRHNGAWVPAYTVAKDIDIFVGATVFISVEADTHDDHNYILVGGTRRLTIHNPILPRS